MTVLKRWLPLLIFAVLAGFLWRGLNRDPHHLPSALIGKSVPKFSAKDLIDQRKTITQKDLKGRVILLNVFASWCMSCRAEHPVLMDIRESHRVDIVGLDFKDQRAEVLKWLRREGNPYSAIIADPSGHIGIDFGVYGTPETYIIDRQGVIRYKYIGPISPQAWQDILLPKVTSLEAH